MVSARKRCGFAEEYATRFPCRRSFHVSDPGTDTLFPDRFKENFPDGGLLIAEQNSKLMAKNEKYHDTVKNTNAHFMSGTDSGQEIADLVPGLRLIEEHSFNEEMRKYSIRGKLFALLLPNMNDRWATFEW